MPKNIRRQLPTLLTAGLIVGLLAVPGLSTSAISSGNPVAYIRAVNTHSPQFQSTSGADTGSRSGDSPEGSSDSPAPVPSTGDLELDSGSPTPEPSPGSTETPGGNGSSIPVGAEETAAEGSGEGSTGEPSPEATLEPSKESASPDPTTPGSGTPSSEPSEEPSAPVSSAPATEPSTAPDSAASYPTTLDPNAKLKGRFPVCHYAGGSYHLLTLPYRALVNHGSHHDDVIPPIENHYAGNRWNSEGIALYAKYCG